MRFDSQSKFLGGKIKKNISRSCLTAFARLSYADAALKWGYDGNIGPALLRL